MIGNRRLLFIVRLVVGGVFIWAGMLKIADPLSFAQDIANYQVFPKWMCVVLAAVLPWVEVFCGIFLISGLFRSASSLILSALLAAFLVLIVSTMARGIDVDCGCFGSLSRKVGIRLLLTDLVLFFMTINLFLSGFKKQER